MITIPKPKFFERKVPGNYELIPVGEPEEDYFDEIYFRQTHILSDAIDRVSFVRIKNNNDKN